MESSVKKIDKNIFQADLRKAVWFEGCFFVAFLGTKGNVFGKIPFV